jgi:serine/threonine-protein kinase ATR
MSAVRKAERYASDSVANEKEPSDSPEAFLQQNIMGIVSHLNHELQEGHGKRSVDAKCKVLRGIKEVITRIGMPIAIVAPQVLFHHQD